MIVPRRGPRLEVDEPRASEREWIFEALQDPAVHVPFACPHGPSREQFDAGYLDLREQGEIESEPVRYWIVRLRESGAPYAFFVEFGWEGWADTTREYDLAIPRSKGSLGLYWEAHVVGIAFIFENRLAKRLRWAVAVSGAAPLRWFERLGARSVGAITVSHPITGEPVTKQVYEISGADLAPTPQ